MIKNTIKKFLVTAPFISGFIIFMIMMIFYTLIAGAETFPNEKIQINGQEPFSKTEFTTTLQGIPKSCMILENGTFGMLYCE